MPSKGLRPMNPADAASGVPLRPRLRGMFRLQWEAEQGAYVLLYPEGRVKLNSSAGEILARCDGVRELDDIIDEMERLFRTNELAADVYRFLDHARLRGWID
jgi:pyrroloquinoline quinone biosynthesis protein D